MDEMISLRFAALADPTRRAMIARLADGPATVAELQKPFALSQPAISKHLKVLEKAGLIEQGRSAQSRPRRLKGEILRETADWLFQIGNLWRDSFDRLDDVLRSSDGETET